MNRVITVVLLGLMACGSAEVTTPPPTEQAPSNVAKDSPEGLALTANAIAKDPAKTAEILEAAGWTEADFEAALLAIAKDAKKSAAYAAAREN